MSLMAAYTNHLSIAHTSSAPGRRNSTAEMNKFRYTTSEFSRQGIDCTELVPPLLLAMSRFADSPLRASASSQLPIAASTDTQEYYLIITGSRLIQSKHDSIPTHVSDSVRRAGDQDVLYLLSMSERPAKPAVYLLNTDIPGCCPSTCQTLLPSELYIVRSTLSGHSESF